MTLVAAPQHCPKAEFTQFASRAIVQVLEAENFRPPEKTIGARYLYGRGRCQSRCSATGPDRARHADTSVTVAGCAAHHARP